MNWVEVSVAIVIGLLSSTGLWAYLNRTSDRKTSRDKLLMGIAYEKILTMGMAFVARGWITDDEYDDFRKYLYDPYLKMGGNGTASRVMAAVDDLPIRPRAQYSEVIQEAKARSSYDPASDVTQLHPAA